MYKFPRHAFLAALLTLSFSACKSNNGDEQQPAVILPVGMAFSTGLPVVVINTPDSCAITSKTEWVKNADAVIHYPDGHVQLLSMTSIRGRGNVTWFHFPKKSYSLKFDKKESIAGMNADKRWVLLANWGDRTLLRNDVAFEIARNTSLEWTPRGTFVELVLNGVYSGSYYLCEKIKIGKGRIDITEMMPDDDDEAVITGGYLMEIDSHEDEDNRFRSEVYGFPYRFRSPDEETLSAKMFDYMRQYVNQLERTLANDKELQSTRCREFVDFQSFADWWIVNELCHDIDVCKLRSIYVYKDRGCAMKAGPVWDFDFATFRPETEIFVAQHFPYIQRLLLVPEFRSFLSLQRRSCACDIARISECRERWSR